MHPAFSVILFTTLSGAGYGLLAWLGVLLASSRLSSLHAISDDARITTGLMLLVLALGLVLAAIGLLASTFHLGKPLRAWRAFSQWRTSWLSREGVLSLATFVPALALMALAWLAWRGNAVAVTRLLAWMPWLGAALCLLSLLTVVCTAMIYASLPPIPAWRHRLVVPVYLGFALLTGGTLLAALSPWFGASAGALRCLALALAVLAVAVTAMKLRYWRAIDTAPLTVTRADAVGMAGRELSVFERPHTEDNYLTREMGYVLARKHARKLRMIALLLFGAAPVLLAALAWLLPNAAWLLFPLAAFAALIGALVERWLFFAQARHLVTLYY
ncbi:dimethyl sulfoxide reductase anchor subunit [Lysobacter sp. 5GHs7-4]|uniref:dimethyl sulfoxide reductase anchor subunit family protein n=1 Tax=Lysobacter sp. 5GHs7-4 TaxID=2904253 RepID=UPI001E418C2B|nr:DmsC/YnfH family molybdoenzyme membrane anchor subunit [Lysobacter sp. 5GHs7-4]UHQ22977.1 dimethyl sulfoxide reductase anchor subunit [Lysobacter sp. 5GHs7-4]